MKLSEWMEREGVSCDALAKRIGRSRQTVYNLAREKGTPTLTVAALVEAATGGEVEIASHLSPAEKKKIGRLRDEIASASKRVDNGEVAGAGGSPREGGGRGKGA